MAPKTTTITNNNNMVFLMTVLCFCCFFATVVSKPESIYEVLRDHGLPAGLMPKGVTEFKFNENGRFEVHLEQECNAKFESELHYERNVTGNLSYGQIGELNGITAQELFLWFPVKGIRVDIPSSGLIYFDVGVVFKQYSLSLFENPHNCTAGAIDKEPFSDVIDEMNIVQVVSKGLSGKFWSWVGRRFGADVL